MEVGVAVIALVFVLIFGNTANAFAQLNNMVRVYDAAVNNETSDSALVP